MKTNQLMNISFEHGDVKIYHKTKTADLTDTFNVGNAYRILSGERAINFTHFMDAKATNIFIDEIAQQQGIHRDKVVQHNGKKGKASRTFANLHFIVYVAMQLSPKFQYEVIDIFINSKVLEFRDEGGNDFKTLNIAIDTLTDRTKELKPEGNRWLYTNIAKMLRSKIFTDEEIAEAVGNIWNTSIALAHHQKLRTDYESKLIMAIEMGYVTTYPELKQAIEKL